MTMIDVAHVVARVHEPRPVIRVLGHARRARPCLITDYPAPVFRSLNALCRP